MSRAKIAVALLAVIAAVAGCTTAGPSPSQQYQDAAARANTAIGATLGRIKAAGGDSVAHAPMYAQLADATRTFEQDIAAIAGTPDQHAALLDLAAVESAIEIAYRAAAATTDAGAQAIALRPLPTLDAREREAVNVVRIRFGLPAATDVGPGAS